jgi:hypothetical protein
MFGAFITPVPRTSTTTQTEQVKNIPSEHAMAEAGIIVLLCLIVLWWVLKNSSKNSSRKCDKRHQTSDIADNFITD